MGMENIKCSKGGGQERYMAAGAVDLLVAHICFERTVWEQLCRDPVLDTMCPRNRCQYHCPDTFAPWLQVRMEAKNARVVTKIATGRPAWGGKPRTVAPELQISMEAENSSGLAKFACGPYPREGSRKSADSVQTLCLIPPLFPEGSRRWPECQRKVHTRAGI